MGCRGNEDFFQIPLEFRPVKRTGNIRVSARENAHHHESGNDKLNVREPLYVVYLAPQKRSEHDEIQARGNDWREKRLRPNPQDSYDFFPENGNERDELAGWIHYFVSSKK